MSLYSEHLLAASLAKYESLRFYSDTQSSTVTISSVESDMCVESRTSIATYFWTPNCFCVVAREDISNKSTNELQVAISARDQRFLAFAPDRIVAYPTHQLLIAALSQDGMMVRVLCKMPVNLFDVDNCVIGDEVREDVQDITCNRITIKRPAGTRTVWLGRDDCLVRKVTEEVEVRETRSSIAFAAWQEAKQLLHPSVRREVYIKPSLTPPEMFTQ